MILAAVSWAAVGFGFLSTWVAGRHRIGWMIGTVGSVLWLGYDIARDIWAGAFAAVVGMTLNSRNYFIGRSRGDDDHEA